MVVIYSQEKTYIKKDAEDARATLISVYGSKIGIEAYNEMKKGHIGASYRKNGGPLVRIIDSVEAEEIRKKEAAIGLLE